MLHALSPEAACQRSSAWMLLILGLLEHHDIFSGQRQPAVLARPDAGANFAVRDFLAVLEWIAQNVRAFGGNPDNVTIFGQSAGAQAVRTLLSTRRARGFFHRGIMQSGGSEPSAIAPSWTFARTQAATEHLMQMVGARTMDDLRPT